MWTTDCQQVSESGGQCNEIQICIRGSMFLCQQPWNVLEEEERGLSTLDVGEHILQDTCTFVLFSLVLSGCTCRAFCQVVDKLLCYVCHWHKVTRLVLDCSHHQTQALQTRNCMVDMETRLNTKKQVVSLHSQMHFQGCAQGDVVDLRGMWNGIHWD